MTLLICLGASVLSSQLILMTEQDRLVMDAKQQLVTHSKQHNFDLIQSINERSELALVMAERLSLLDALPAAETDIVSPELEVSDSGHRFGIWNESDSGYVLGESVQLDQSTLNKIEHASHVFEELSPQFLAHFLNV